MPANDDGMDSLALSADRSHKRQQSPMHNFFRVDSTNKNATGRICCKLRSVILFLVHDKKYVPWSLPPHLPASSFLNFHQNNFCRL
jgi:hypothetical protein